jgi:uncharacterized membrane protein
MAHVELPARTPDPDRPAPEAVRRSRLARLGTALFWIVSGALHFVIPRKFESFVPPVLGRWRRELVVTSAIAEIAGGLAVLPDRTRRWARWSLLATLLAVYPANINMATNSKDYREIPAPALWARLPLQFLFARITWRGTR